MLNVSKQVCVMQRVCAVMCSSGWGPAAGSFLARKEDACQQRMPMAIYQPSALRFSERDFSPHKTLHSVARISRICHTFAGYQLHDVSQ